jgi:hypothetical protein
VLSLDGCLDEEEVASAAEVVQAPLPMKGGISGLKVFFLFPSLLWEDIVKVVGQTSFSLNRGDEAEKEGFWPMRKCLGEQFGVVFSFAVVVTGMEPSPSLAFNGTGGGTSPLQHSMSSRRRN